MICFAFQVHKLGTALGRSVDLSRFDGYESLIVELDQMFEFKGGLADRSSGWQVIYTDDEGDVMMIGDYPWLLSILQFFSLTKWRIYFKIYVVCVHLFCLRSSKSSFKT